MITAPNTIINRSNGSIESTKFLVKSHSIGSNIFLGVSSEGKYCVFVLSQASIEGPVVSTKQVSFKEGGKYTIKYQNGEANFGTYDSLMCDSNNADEQRIFKNLLGSYLSDVDLNYLPKVPLKKFFHTIIDLFATKQTKDLKNVRIGLWGELFFMRTIFGYPTWLNHWHSDIDNTFDFSSGNHRIEIKTTTTEPRIHYFSHQQLFSANNFNISIVSISVQESNQGISLQELISECRLQVGSLQNIIKLEKAIIHAGMMGDNEAGPSFDIFSAKEKLLIFGSSEIPHFMLPEPQGIIQTKYKINLEYSTPILDSNVLSYLSIWNESGI